MKIIRLLLLLALIAPSFAASTVSLTGTIILPNGSPLNGSIAFYLPFAGATNTADPGCASNSCPIVFQGPVVFPIVNGSLKGSRSNPTLNATLVGNGDIYPANTYYEVRIKNSSGTFSQSYFLYVPSITQGSTFDVGSAFQTAITVPNVSFPTSVLVNWASPAPIGSSVPNSGTFTNLSVNDLSALGTDSAFPSSIGFTPDPFNKCDNYWSQLSLPKDQLIDENSMLFFASQNQSQCSRVLTARPIPSGTDGSLAGIVPASVSGSPDLVMGAPVQILLIPGTFAALTALYPCSSANEGRLASITDSTVSTYGSVIVGGNTNHVLGYCDGTSYKVH